MRRLFHLWMLMLVGLAMSHATPSEKKTVVAHRGASAYAPEHTLESYRLAIEQHADFVEQDLGITKDGVLVCLHDTSLERTTNVEEVFPDRFTEDRSGPNPVRRWFVHDFTLAEIARLDAGSWFDAKFAGARVPTWQDAIDLIRGKAGLFPELKSPEVYRARGVAMEPLVVEMLRKNGLDRTAADSRTPVILQSFEATSLRTLARLLPALPRVLLIEAKDAPQWLSPARLKELATFATGIGPAKGIVDAQPEVVRWAHDAGLTVTPYTFRSRSTGRFATVRDEMAYFLFTLGVDAVFTDNPDQVPRKH